MKVSQHNIDNTDIQTGPKLRNIHDEKEIIEEKPEGADVRLKIAVIVLGILIAFIGIKGFITKSSLMSQVEEQQKLLTAAEAEALMYGITEDEDGDLVIPEVEEPVNVSDMDWSSKWDSISARNMDLLDSFAHLLLDWDGNNEYEKNRQTLINDWGFTENNKLLSSFMPKMDDDMDAHMTLPKGSVKSFLLENDGKNMTYFLLCDVRNTVNGISANGKIGIHITINENGTVSNVFAQTIS